MMPSATSTTSNALSAVARAEMTAKFQDYKARLGGREIHPDYVPALNLMNARFDRICAIHQDAVNAASGTKKDDVKWKAVADVKAFLGGASDLIKEAQLLAGASFCMEECRKILAKLDEYEGSADVARCGPTNRAEELAAYAELALLKKAQ